MPVYFIRNQNGNVKIGHSVNPAKRLSHLQTGASETLFLMRMISGDVVTEEWLHRQFANFRIRGEWFEFHEDMLTIFPPGSHPIDKIENGDPGAHALRKYRRTAGLSLGGMAQRCGASVATLSRIERGIQWPSKRLAQRLLNATENKVSFSDFLAFKSEGEAA